MLLQPMLSRLANARGLEGMLNVALRDFVSLHGAEMGDLQLVGNDGALVIVAARGVDHSFLKTFERISAKSGSACGRAARDGKPTFTPDVTRDPEYAPYMEFVSAMPLRSVLSCPLLAPDGSLIGMLSALSSTHFNPTQMELEAATQYCSALSAALSCVTPAEGLAAWAEGTAAALLNSTPKRGHSSLADDRDSLGSSWRNVTSEGEPKSLKNTY